MPHIEIIMKKTLLAIGCWLALTAGAAEGRLAQYVNPWIGTGGHGHVFLGANVPFGFVQLGPTQHTRGWDWCSGYHISDSLLLGFSHTHLSGTGVGELGDVTMLPVANPNQKETLFSHDNETVHPGYYSIKLKEPNVMVELTATERVGMHKYTFGGDVKNGFLRIDLQQGIGWDRPTDCRMQLVNQTMLTGRRLSTGWAKQQHVYFAAVFSQPVSIVSMSDTVAVLKVADTRQPLIVKCGLSAVSENNALLNLNDEMPEWDFQHAVAAAEEKWERQLGKITVEGDENDKVILYTALYHTMIAPSVFCDVNGEYRSADGNVASANFTNYTTFSLWDTYRAAHPLMTIIHPDRMADMAKTMIDICRKQGKLPVWHLMGNETDCMVGNPAVPVLADMVLKGFVDDKMAAFEAMKTSAMLDERGMDMLKKYGYLPFDKVEGNESVSKGLEYALADWCIAQVAGKFGKKKDYRYFYDRSMAYKHYFDKNTEFMRGKDSNGNFHSPFDPFQSVHQNSDYTEGNAWQYTWLVPHDVHGLVKLFGSEQRLVQKLDSLFIVEGDLGKDASPDVSGLIGQYAHGNEPSHHVIYMYNYLGQPWKAAPMLRKVMRELYSNSPDGLCGNEDVGQMSAWFVLSSMGIYQVEPAGGKYVIGSPLFNKVSVDVGNGKTFTVIANNNSPENIYVQSATLNGKNLSKSYISHNDIVRGATLVLEMGPKPSLWATEKNNRP